MKARLEQEMKTGGEGGPSRERPLNEILGNLCLAGGVIRSQCRLQVITGCGQSGGKKETKRGKEELWKLHAYQHNSCTTKYSIIYLKTSPLYLLNG